MDFKKYAETTKPQLPPSLEGGQVLASVSRVEQYTFDLNGKPTNALRVFADGKEFRTSSKVLIEQFTKYFESNAEPLTNVKVIAPRGKNYLTLEGA